MCIRDSLYSTDSASTWPPSGIPPYAMLLCVFYGMPSTDFAYAATRLLCAVLTHSMLLRHAQY
eukprot:537627-Rhodomonas_salina.2